MRRSSRSQSDARSLTRTAYVSGTRKTTLYLPEELKRAVERTARETRRSEAEVIRAALNDYTMRRRPRPRVGTFAHGSLADRVDELLRRGFGRDRSSSTRAASSSATSGIPCIELRATSSTRSLGRSCSRRSASPRSDYLLRTHVGQEEQLDFLDDVASGAYTLVPIDAEAVALARDSIRRHAALEPSVADASLVVVADRYGTDRLLTIDERDFRVLVPSDGRPFRLLPADA